MLTNGWDGRSREAAAKQFGLDINELNDRHHLTFDTYESGKLSLDEYLERSVFYRDRSFTAADFRKFMFEQSVAYPEMIQLVKGLKARFDLRIAVVNNEGRELNEYRIGKFGLEQLCRFFRQFLFCAFPEAGCGHLESGAGYCAGATR